jgi:hypothetical protein
MGEIEGFGITFCKQIRLLSIKNGLKWLISLLYFCKLTEFSIKMTFRLRREKGRKWGVKSVDLTEYSISLTDIWDSSATFLEMMLMFSEKDCILFGKT